MGNSNQDRKRNEYLEERKFISENEIASSNSFDKAMTTLTASGFGLSIALLRYVAPNPVRLVLLAISWFFLGLALVSTLTSFLFSQKAWRKQLDNLERDYRGEVADGEELVNIFARITPRLNEASLLFFVVGVFFFALFSYYNLPAGGEM